ELALPRLPELALGEGRLGAAARGLALGGSLLASGCPGSSSRRGHDPSEGPAARAADEEGRDGSRGRPLGRLRHPGGDLAALGAVRSVVEEEQVAVLLAELGLAAGQVGGHLPLPAGEVEAAVGGSTLLREVSGLVESVEERGIVRRAEGAERAGTGGRVER